jgi:hypothetical protein
MHSKENNFIFEQYTKRLLKEQDDDEPMDMSDVEADADTLAGAGYGTEEDYGKFSDEDPNAERRLPHTFSIGQDVIYWDDDGKTYPAKIIQLVPSMTIPRYYISLQGGKELLVGEGEIETLE